MTNFTRRLVLAGLVALVNFQGVTGQANRLLAAEAGTPPENYAAAANRDFAFDLYRELAKEKSGKNLFFSPYSMTTVLTMAIEGARGETAAEMGKVLCFPSAVRRTGNDAELIPWNVSLIHTGMAELNRRLTAPNPDAREEIDTLRKEIDAAKARAEKESKAAREDRKAAGKKMKACRNEKDKAAAQAQRDAATKLMVSAEKHRDEYRAAVRKAEEFGDELNERLTHVDQYELNVANAVWVERTYPILQSYLDAIHRFYGAAGAFPMDFVSNPEPCRQKINGWVESQTHKRIRNLLPQRSINSLTRLVLTNAIYFKGGWAEVFEKDKTEESDFLLPAGVKTRIPMMHHGYLRLVGYSAFNGNGTPFDTPATVRPNEKQAFYPDERGFLMLEMPYKGGGLSMIVVVPQSSDGLPALEKSLTPANVQSWIAKIEERPVHGFMPKFRMETGYNMNDTLRAMGMARALVAPTAAPNRGAEFDGIAAVNDPVQKLYIGVVVHKAFVEVDEKGTEAAAATGTCMGAKSAEPKDEPFIPTFRADKPFLFLIRDKRTGCILFLGRMVNPKE